MARARFEARHGPPMAHYFGTKKAASAGGSWVNRSSTGHLPQLVQPGRVWLIISRHMPQSGLTGTLADRSVPLPIAR